MTASLRSQQTDIVAPGTQISADRCRNKNTAGASARGGGYRGKQCGRPEEPPTGQSAPQPFSPS